MFLRVKHGQHLKFIAQGQGGVVRLRGEEFVVEAAAVADAVTLRVEGQAGHQHQRGGIVGNRPVGNGFGDPGVALGNLG